MSVILLPTRVVATLLLSVLLAYPALADETLTLKQAVQIALAQDDPSIGQYIAVSESKYASAIADSQLPDPKVKFGVANIATNSFNLNQEPMTQLQFGVHQSFVSGAKRKLMREKGKAGSEAFKQMASSRELNLKLEVERIWLSLHHNELVLKIVTQKKVRLMEMLDALDAKFESGRTTAQRILTMEAELALLDDRAEALELNGARSRVALARYIGEEHAAKPMAGGYKGIAVPKALTILEEGLNFHPEIRIEKAMVKANEKAENIANENYKPNWGVDLGYGYRAAGRPDMATALITFDVPLFTDKRQDKRLISAKKSKSAAILKMRTKELNMLRQVRAAYVTWQKSSKRINLYNTVVLERTKSASVASENAYASGSADFAEIIRTHLSELDARLKLEAIKLERALAQIELKYYGGEAT